jgi:uncharacterized protein (DUF39 family)
MQSQELRQVQAALVQQVALQAHPSHAVAVAVVVQVKSHRAAIFLRVQAAQVVVERVALAQLVLRELSIQVAAAVAVATALELSVAVMVVQVLSFLNILTHAQSQLAQVLQVLQPDLQVGLR